MTNLEQNIQSTWKAIEGLGAVLTDDSYTAGEIKVYTKKALNYINTSLCIISEELSLISREIDNLPRTPAPQEGHLDLANPDEVEIIIAHDHRPKTYRVWVNVDGVCRFRACRVKAVSIEDTRPQS